MRLLLGLVLLALAPVGLAGHTPVGRCDSEGEPAVGLVQVGVSAEVTFYLDDRGYLTGHGLWIYQESNGIWSEGLDWAHNLQRGGSSPYFPVDNDICVDSPLVVPDTMIA